MTDPLIPDFAKATRQRRQVVEGMLRVNETLNNIAVDEKMRVSILLNLIGYYIANSEIGQKAAWVQNCMNAIGKYVKVYAGIGNLGNVQ